MKGLYNGDGSNASEMLHPVVDPEALTEMDGIRAAQNTGNEAAAAEELANMQGHYRDGLDGAMYYSG